MEMAMISVLFQLPRKSKNHEGGQTRRDQSFAKYTLNSSPHEERLIEERE